MSLSLIAFDTDHIKRFVFGTNRLKEIRGASSILDRLNRTETVKIAKAEPFKAKSIYAHGGSALFIVETQQADALGKAVQKCYHEQTQGGASVTYAIQPIPGNTSQDKLMTTEQLDENTTMEMLLKLLRLRLRLAKESQQLHGRPKNAVQKNDGASCIALPTHALLCTCESCGLAYAQDLWMDAGNPNDPDRDERDEGRYCRVCIGKRQEDRTVKEWLTKVQTIPSSSDTLWERILQTLGASYLPATGPFPRQPKDFDAFREFTTGKKYFGLIYADANNMGRALEQQKTLLEMKKFATQVDQAVFETMGNAIRTHLPLQEGNFPFDILLIGGDDIVLVVPADKAMQVAHTLAEQFPQASAWGPSNKGKYTLSVGVVLAPVKYPFGLQYALVSDTLKAAKDSGAKRQVKNSGKNEKQDPSRVNFVVITGSTSLSYQKQYEELCHKNTNYEFYATMRPYTVENLAWLLEQLKKGHKQRLGRTKLNQLREAILKKNHFYTTFEALSLLRNLQADESKFIKQMVQKFDRRSASQQQMGILFPWSFDGKESHKNLTVYRTPLLDFIELYDFV